MSEMQNDKIRLLHCFPFFFATEYAVSLESDIKDKTDDPEQALLLILHKV